MQRPAPAPAFDAARFQRLIDIIGPAQAGVFRAQLVTDLADCDARLVAGARTADWQLLREASHDLIALAGAAAADALTDGARQMNAAAHARDQATLAALQPALAQGIAQLIAQVRPPPQPPDAAR